MLTDSQVRTKMLGIEISMIVVVVVGCVFERVQISFVRGAVAEKLLCLHNQQPNHLHFLFLFVHM